MTTRSIDPVNKPFTDSPDFLASEYGGTWGEHPDFPVDDWKTEVANDDTRLGYWEWVCHH